MFLEAAETKEYADSMAWAILKHSKSQVDRAGRDYLGENLFARVDAFPVIENWRTAHSYPLNIMQDGLRKRAKSIDEKAIVAQRLKRLPSIVAKLEGSKNMRLSAMQDIGGCRAIMRNVQHVRQLSLSFVESRIRHELCSIDDYIFQPKASGYRGVHLVYKYISDRQTTWNGLKIEVQLRSTLQHIWATAVETVGLFTKQSLKASKGTEEWLRLFSLMGTVLAQKEKMPTIPDTPTDTASLRGELHSCVGRVNALDQLSACVSSMKAVETSKINAHHFLILLDLDTRSINIRGYRRDQLQRATEDYSKLETEIKAQNKDAVLVSVDSIALLKRAYPNYFLDTGLFRQLLQEAIR